MTFKDHFMTIDNALPKKNKSFRRIGFFIGYTLFVILVSSLITTAYFHYFVLNQDTQETLISVNDTDVKNSPIKDEKNIIEIFSYGCSYCAVNEANVAKLEERMPEGTRLIRLHISSEQPSGLARFAPLFATLSVMGIEENHRQSAYKAVLKDNIDLTDNNQLDAWLKDNGIDLEQYQKTRQSAEVKELLDYMTAVRTHYNINATPTFIVDKKWVALQDRKFPAFSDHLLSLLQQDKALDK